MIKKVLSKSFMRPIVDSEDRYLMGTGEQRAYLRCSNGFAAAHQRFVGVGRLKLKLTGVRAA